eukprot:CAMPEP_0169385084 /NCGR_PEP_ID=MMETSP1017-20121227/43865_1 /TAXON_ID=342587 /ORGANISM="Karlodinium micrum, Strain CCMP2283" /LENGTH=1806 /DNA_ID=CAMNT_0009485871 /DNA_START=606 /DNA_END=6023 /DNA_ORIENTATION=+
MVVFLFSVFSIVGLNFWAGAMYRLCRTTQDPVWDAVAQCWSWETSESRLCGGRYMCETGHRCGSIYSEETQESLRPNFGDATWTPGRVPGEGAPWCPSTLSVHDSEDFNFRFTTFDHMPSALLIVFQSMTMEGWVDLMYMLQDADSDLIASVFFVILVAATAFFLLNAALAIVTETFEDAMGDDGKEEEQPDQGDGQWAHQAAASEGKSSRVHPVEFVDPVQGTGNPLESSAKQEVLEVKDVVSDEISPPMPPENMEKPQEEVVGPLPLKPIWAENQAPKESLKEDKDADAESEEGFMEDHDWDQPPWFDCSLVRAFRVVASNEWFVNIVMFFIVFNVITMCLDGYPPPPAAMQIFLSICNYVFAIAFSVEMAVLLVALGPYLYWTGVMTAFDGIVVIASWVEICMSGGGGAVRAFRGLRLLRIFKLAKKWTSFRVIIKAMIGTIMSLGNLGVLLFIMIFIFTLMGMEFFALEFQFKEDGHRFPETGTWTSCYNEKDNYSCVPRAHFDTFLWAFITVYQILTGENWNAIMYDGMKASNLYIAYFVLVMVFGQFIMLSLFLAVLMSKFEESREQTEEQEAEAAAKRTTSFTPRPSLVSRAASNAKLKMKSISFGLKPSTNTTQTNSSGSGIASEESMTEVKSGNLFPKNAKGNDAEKARLQNASANLLSVIPSTSGSNLTKEVCSWPRDYAFFLVSRDTSLRKFCQVMVMNKRFDQVVLICICFSSLAMALDSPMADPSGVLPITLYWANLLFTFIFTVEMLTKMVAHGVFWSASQKHGYWTQPWNILDGVVVIVSVIDIVLQGEGALSAMKTLRVMRALRPLRVVSRFENLRLVVQTLFSSVPALANVMIVGVLVFLIFALFFLSYFKGKFFACMTVEDGELASFSFDPNVSFIWNAAGTAAMSLFLADGSQVPLTAADQANIRLQQPNPLCVNPHSGIVNPVGSMSSERTGRWMASGACPAGLVLAARPMRDAPVCVGHCNPTQSKDDRRPKQCPSPPDRPEELPSFCSSAYSGLGLVDALRSTPSISDPDEQKGFDYYASITRRDIMFCRGGVDSNGASYPGCIDLYCPEGCPDPPCDDRKSACKKDCEMHPIMCSDSCQNSEDNSPSCLACREQCQAQCQCSEYCSGFVKDAANCVEQGGRWDQALSQSFDTIFASFLTLLEISTTEGWVDVMYQAVDAVNPMMEPIRDYAEPWAIAFMLFIFVSFFFYINLCVGVIVDNYNELKDSPPITKSQAEWICTQKSLHKRTYFFGLTHLDHHPKLQVKAFRFITAGPFENFIMLCIILNTLCMALKQFPYPSKAYEDVREICNTIFGAVFFLEMVIKLYALRLNYFKESWNRFDFCCVMSTVVGVIVQLVSDVEMASAMSAIRAFRIARLFRLVRFLRGLNRMFTALILSLPKLINVGGILLLFFFLFSVLGVQLFAKVKFHGPHDTHANFRDPGRAFLTLMRSVTGEGWNEIMHALSRDLGYFSLSLGDVCVSEDLLAVNTNTYPVLQSKCLVDTPNGCGKDLSYIYFMVFTLVMSMVMVNLMIAVILEAFSDSSSNDLIEVIDTCLRLWPKYDYDLDLKASLKDTFKFIFEVAACHGIDLMPTEETEKSTEGSKESIRAPYESKGSSVHQSIMNFGTSMARNLGDALPTLGSPDTDNIDMDMVSSHIANLCEVKVLSDGRVHFLYAVRLAVAVTLSHNDPTVLQEFEECEKNDKRLQNLKKVQVERVLDPTESWLDYEKAQAGAKKIQEKFRAMRHSRTNLHEKNSKAENAEATAEPNTLGTQEGRDPNHGPTIVSAPSRGSSDRQLTAEEALV